LAPLFIRFLCAHLGVSNRSCSTVRWATDWPIRSRDCCHRAGNTRF